MHFDIFTLFPSIFEGAFQESILSRAQEIGALSIALHNIRDYATDKHHTTDDAPYGGGGGMVMKPGPIFRAVEDVLELEPGQPTSIPVILLTPQGRLFTQKIADELAQHDRLVLICGRYEGVDERVREHLATDEISIGDYVLTGGEIPAMIIVDAVTRLLPGVLGDPSALIEDSHVSGLLEHPHYTRPVEFRGWHAPEVLLSGHHARVACWRREQSLKRTWERRPGLLEEAELSEADRKFLRRLSAENSSCSCDGSG
ncbi:MAG: tRNA (guanosine(37)-N1)-methyltransferase TrmD [Chloroflexota bacterium]|nr:tRNA (guanosine(37)-N1)-methyltransferase TrmD [Chloroflexota bacterium]